MKDICLCARLIVFICLDLCLCRCLCLCLCASASISASVPNATHGHDSNNDNNVLELEANNFLTTPFSHRIRDFSESAVFCSYAFETFVCARLNSVELFKAIFGPLLCSCLTP